MVKVVNWIRAIIFLNAVKVLWAEPLEICIYHDGVTDKWVSKERELGYCTQLVKILQQQTQENNNKTKTKRQQNKKCWIAPEQTYSSNSF